MHIPKNVNMNTITNLKLKFSVHRRFETSLDTLNNDGGTVGENMPITSQLIIQNSYKFDHKRNSDHSSKGGCHKNASKGTI